MGTATDKLIKAAYVLIEWSNSVDSSRWHQHIERLAIEIAKDEAERRAQEQQLLSRQTVLEQQRSELSGMTSAAAAWHHRLLFKLLLRWTLHYALSPTEQRATKGSNICFMPWTRINNHI